MGLKLITEVELPAGAAGRIRHGAPLLTLGSCFADEIGRRMERDLFDITVNPFGPLYNPVSLLRAVERCAENRLVEASELVENEGLSHSFLFHSRFSGTDPDETAARLSERLSAIHDLLPHLSAVTLTLGSARCFRLKETGEVVANCHKLPQDRFTLCDLSPAEISDALERTVAILREFSPEIFTVVTVSPIRHKAYGYHTDRLSKAALLLGADSAIKCLGDRAVYFPSYEIMNDELRGYRFYASDMIHPSEVAADYIYSRFAETFYDPATSALCREARPVTGRLLHRPLNAATAESTRSAALRTADDFIKLHPALTQALGRFVSTYIKK